jgi:predicted Rossmann-fold nucleotide-binding protein
VPDRKRAIKSIAVFASSRDLIDPVYKKAACDLGVFLANQNYQVYFGGLFIGLMDDFARSILDNNGQLIGYLPKNLIPYADRMNNSICCSMKTPKNTLIQ